MCFIEVQFCLQPWLLLVVQAYKERADKSLAFLEKSPSISKLQLNQFLAVRDNIIYDHDSMKWWLTIIHQTTLFHDGNCGHSLLKTVIVWLLHVCHSKNCSTRTYTSSWLSKTNVFPWSSTHQNQASSTCDYEISTTGEAVHYVIIYLQNTGVLGALDIY